MTTSPPSAPPAGLDHRSPCWEKAIFSFATARIFQRKKRIYLRRLQQVTVLGVIVPAFGYGGIGITGITSAWAPFILAVGGILGVLQALLSGAAIAYSWQESYAYAAESEADNEALSSELADLARNSPVDDATFRSRLATLDSRAAHRTAGDLRQDISPEERRAGHRQALFHFRRKCGACDIVPSELKPTTCDACGNFAKGLLK